MNPLTAMTPADRLRRAEIDRLAREGRVADLVGRLDDASWLVRRAVVAALARAGDAAVGPLCGVLRDHRDSESRLAAAVDALVAATGDVEARMVDLTEDANIAVVCDAVQVLGRRKAHGAVKRLAKLTTDRNDNVALAAIEAIGRIGGSEVVDLLVHTIEGGNFFRVFPAIDVLGRTGDPRAVAPLAALLDHPHYAIEAARALGRTGDPQALGALVGLLGKPNDALVRAGAVALAEVHERATERYGTNHAVADALARVDGESAGRKITHALKGADAAERQALCRVLGWTGGVGAVRGLLELLDDEPETAHSAALALSTLAREVEPLLAAALRDGASEQRLLLLPILGLRGSVSPEVLACLGDSNVQVRALACDAIGKRGDPAAVPALFEVLRDPDARVAQAAVAAIQALGGQEARRLALRSARSDDPRERRSALRILSYFGWPSALEVFLEAMNDPDERLRDLAGIGLASIDDPRATAALLAGAQHTSPRTRAAAVRALGHTGGSASVRDTLRSGLADPDAWVRYYACQALSRFQDDASADVIAALVDDPAGHVRVAAIDALARLHGERALAILHQALLSPDADVQRAALLGVAAVRSPSSLPHVLQTLRSEDAATRLVALSALAELPQREALDGLTAATRDADASVRAAALTLLGNRAGPEATNVLIESLSNPSIRERGLAALSQPTSGRIEALVVAMRTARGEVASSLVSALARMRGPEATAALQDLMATGPAAVRRVVAPALSALGAPESRALLQRAAAEDADPEVRSICAALLRR
ncbi:MAG TPA: HEAT repeat domain-containing protein [Polyangiaceae bacterium]